jgi:serine/threonine kinase PknH
MLIHRDVKPSNVLVRGQGEDEFAYLIDFGIARPVTTGSTPLTAMGATIGTLAYMAPERFGSGAIDGRVDVYSLACVLFELVAGMTPFRTTDPAALIHAHIALDPPRLSAHHPGAPAELDAVIARGMAKNPGDRYLTSGTMVAAARTALEASIPLPALPTVASQPRNYFAGQPAQLAHPRPPESVAPAERYGLRNSSHSLPDQRVAGRYQVVMATATPSLTWASRGCPHRA